MKDVKNWEVRQSLFRVSLGGRSKWDPLRLEKAYIMAIVGPVIRSCYYRLIYSAIQTSEAKRDQLLVNDLAVPQQRVVSALSTFPAQLEMTNVVPSLVVKPSMHRCHPRDWVRVNHWRA